MEIKVTRKSMSAIADIGAIPRRSKKGLVDALNDVGNEFVKEERRLEKAKDKTGRIYKFRGGRHQASARGEVPAQRTGRLARSTGYRTHNYLHMSFGQEVDYAKYLAEGTKRMAARGNLHRAINNKSILAGQILQQYVSKEAKLD